LQQWGRAWYRKKLLAKGKLIFHNTGLRGLGTGRNPLKKLEGAPCRNPKSVVDVHMELGNFNPLAKKLESRYYCI